jgi:hypothetical protein
MTRLDAIKTIGDVITEIDVARGELRDPAIKLRLDDARTLLNHRVIQLVNVPLDDTSEQFQETMAILEAGKSQIAGGNLLPNLDEFVGNTRLLAALPGGGTSDYPGRKRKTT